MYQVEVLNYGLKAYYYQSLLKIDSLSYLKETLIAMTLSLFHLSTPSLELECYGDTDRISIKDVSTMTSSLFEEPSFKSLGTKQFDFPLFIYLFCPSKFPSLSNPLLLYFSPVYVKCFCS